MSRWWTSGYSLGKLSKTDDLYSCYPFSFHTWFLQHEKLIDYKVEYQPLFYNNWVSGMSWSRTTIAACTNAWERNFWIIWIMWSVGDSNYLEVLGLVVNRAHTSSVSDCLYVSNGLCTHLPPPSAISILNIFCSNRCLIILFFSPCLLYPVFSFLHFYFWFLLKVSDVVSAFVLMFCILIIFSKSRFEYYFSSFVGTESWNLFTWADSGSHKIWKMYRHLLFSEKKCIYVYECVTTFMPGSHGDQRRASDPLKLKLQVVVS